VGIFDVPRIKGVLSKIVKVIADHYIGMSHKIFIVNPPAAIDMMWAAVKKFLTERQLQKLILVKHGDTSLTDLFAPNQLEMSYGGTRRNLGCPFYPFRFVPEPFAESPVSEKHVVHDIHKKLLKPQWTLWATPRLQTEQPLKLELLSIIMPGDPVTRHSGKGCTGSSWEEGDDCASTTCASGTNEGEFRQDSFYSAVSMQSDKSMEQPRNGQKNRTILIEDAPTQSQQRKFMCTLSCGTWSLGCGLLPVL